MSSQGIEFAAQLRMAREAKGWSQEELAQKLKGSRGKPMSKQAVIYWETSVHTPKPTRLKELEALLGIRFDLTGAGFAPDVSPIPPGVTQNHLEAALHLSRLSKPEQESFSTLLAIAAARAEGKPINPFFEFNTRKEKGKTKPFNVIESANEQQSESSSGRSASKLSGRGRRSPAKPAG